MPHILILLILCSNILNLKFWHCTRTVLHLNHGSRCDTTFFEKYCFTSSFVFKLSHHFSPVMTTYQRINDDDYRTRKLKVCCTVFSHFSQGLKRCEISVVAFSFLCSLIAVQSNQIKMTTDSPPKGFSRYSKYIKMQYNTYWMLKLGRILFLFYQGVGPKRCEDLVCQVSFSLFSHPRAYLKSYQIIDDGLTTERLCSPFK